MKKYFSFIFLIVICLSLAISVTANSVLPTQTEQYFINDFSDALNDSQEVAIFQRSEEISAKTGAEIVVVVVDFYGDTTIDKFATDLFNRWQIGNAEKNNGILLVFSTGEENYYFLPGKGIESSLTQEYLNSVIASYTEPAFAQGDYATAISDSYTQIANQVEKHYDNLAVLEAQQKEQSRKDKTNSIIRVVLSITAGLVVLFIILLLIRARNLRKREIKRRRRQKVRKYRDAEK